jgi:hypothetical protein
MKHSDGGTADSSFLASLKRRNDKEFSRFFRECESGRWRCVGSDPTFIQNLVIQNRVIPNLVIPNRVIENLVIENNLVLENLVIPNGRSTARRNLLLLEVAVTHKYCPGKVKN